MELSPTLLSRIRIAVAAVATTSACLVIGAGGAPANAQSSSTGVDSEAPFAAPAVDDVPANDDAAPVVMPTRSQHDPCPACGMG